MPRFYKPQRAEFIEDGIYQPPWELLMGVLEKKDAETQNIADEIEFARGIKLEYHPREKERAQRLVEDFRTQADDLARDFQENPDDPEVKTRLRNLRRQTQEGFEFGEYKELSDTKTNIEELKARLEVEVENPYRRAKYENDLIEGYFNDPLREGPFKYDGALYDKRNLLEEMADSSFFTGMTPDQISKGFSYIANDGYLTTGVNAEGGLAAERVKKAARDFLEQSVSPGYMQHGEDYFDESWLNEDGEIDFEDPNKEGYKLIEAMATGKAFTNKSSTVQKSGDPYRESKVGGRAARKLVTSSGMSESVAKYYNISERGKEVVQANAARYRALAEHVTNTRNMTDNEVEAFIQTAREAGPEGANAGIYETIRNLDISFNAEMKSGLGHLFNKTEEQLEAISKDLALPSTAEKLITNPGEIHFEGEVVRHPNGEPIEYPTQMINPGVELLLRDSEIKVTGVKGVAGTVSLFPGAKIENSALHDGATGQIEVEYHEPYIIDVDGDKHVNPNPKTRTLRMDFYSADTPISIDDY